MFTGQQTFSADYQVLTNSITDIFFALDKNLRCTFWNKASEDFSGIKAINALGKSVLEVFPQATEPVSEHDFLQVLRFGKPVTLLNHYEFNGKTLYLEVDIYPTGDGLSIFARDITDRIAVQHRLQESEARFRRIFDESPVSAAIVSLQFRFLRLNSAFCNFTGYSQDELLKMKFSEISLAEDLPADETSIRLLIAGEIDLYEREKHYVCKDGKLKCARLSVRAIRDPMGQPLYLIPILQDINDLKDYTEQLVKAKEKAEEMNRRKSIFLTSISHDLRTPLNGILGFSELLMEEKDLERIRRMAEVINKSGDRLLETLNLILDLSKLETGAVNLKLESVDISRLAEESVEIFRAAARIRNLEINLINQCIGLSVISDRKILLDILNNLINNAIKFTPAGEITIGLDQISHEGKEWCIMEVSDTGIGISEENLKVIFDEFQQIPDDIDPGIKGSGLGLSLCKRYTELLDGKITVSSQINVGSKFTFWLPITNK
jgi:PAS domain S-box-containing protein